MFTPNRFFNRPRLIGCVLVLMFVLPTTGGSKVHAANRVLVLHAYHQGWEWTDRITEGIQSVLQPFEKDIVLFVEYLDLNRSHSEWEFNQLADLLRFKLSRSSFDAVIVSGDGALRFARQFGEELFPGAPLVFCGVSPWAFTPLFRQGGETGVMAQVEHGATLELMLDLHPECRRIVVLADRSTVGREMVEAFQTALEPVRQKVTVAVWDDLVWDELPARLVSLAHGDLLYLLIFDFNQGVSSAETAGALSMVSRWCPVPMYGSLQFYIGRGIVGGMITSGFEQGTEAAQMVLRILSGEPVNEIAILERSPNAFIFDGRELQRFHLKPSRLPPQHVVIHPTPNFRERHAYQFIWFAFAMLAAALVFLASALRQRRKHRLLVEKNAALDGRVREKNIQLRLIHQRLKKQSILDDVTGLPNRRHIHQRFVEEVKKAKRYGQALSIILFDIDWLKNVNLEHGYALGDMILRDVGQIIKRGIREIDLVGRYGGEEYLVVLPNTQMQACRQTAERIQHAIAERQWEPGGVTITVSAALAEWDAHTAADLAKVVSDLLAETKSQGASRMVMA